MTVNSNATDSAAGSQVMVSTAQSGQYLVFRVLGHRFALDILAIKEIVEVTLITRVPKAHPAVRGVMNLRGTVAPVVDLGRRLCDQSLELDRRSIVLVVELDIGKEKQTLGMLATEVSEIVEINEQDIQGAPDFGAGIRRDFIDRMARIDGDFIVLLDLKAVLSFEELSLQQEYAGSEKEHAPA